ncbi:MAG: choice-of-anchor Q domain-containing protein [Dysgonomonas sp.]
MKKILLLFIAVVSISLTLSAQQRFVTVTGNGDKSGYGWENASDDLQAMLDILNEAGGGQIWVAAGTYYPTIPAGWAGAGDPRNRSFIMRKNVKVYGGFNGTETTLDQRDWKVNETILSGDLNNDGTANAGDAYHVAVFAGDLGDVLLDGFTVKGAYAGEPAAENTVIVNGGIEYEIYHGTGAGIYANNDQTTLYRLNNLLITGNRTTGHGAGMYVDQNSTVELTNSVVTDNHAKLYGGGVTVSGSNWSNGTITLDRTATLNAKNSLICKNESMRGPGVHMLTYKVNVTLTNVTLADNKATEIGTIEAIYGHHPSGATYTLTLQNTLCDGDIKYSVGTPVQTMNNSMVRGWDEATINAYGANNIGYSNPLFSDPDNNDYTLKQGSPVIDKGNNAYATGIEKDLSDKTRIVNSTIDMGAYEYQGIPLGIANSRDNNNQIWADGKNLHATVDSEGLLNVYTLTGISVIQYKLSKGENVVELPAGFYIVKANDLIRKIIIR